MTTTVTTLLLGIFLVHLGAFAYLGLRRRQIYYAALVLTFSLLSASMAMRLSALELEVAQGLYLHHALRMAAWPAAAVSIGWSLVRARARVRHRRSNAP